MFMRRLAIAVVCMACCLVAAASAHDEYRIIGTVTKVSATSLDVKQSKDGKTISMRMNTETIVTRNKKKVDRAEVKTGANVVVDALGDSMKDLLVVEVRLVPPPAKK
jgi:hypothetical protein